MTTLRSRYTYSEATLIKLRQESSAPSGTHTCKTCPADAEQSERSRSPGLDLGSNSRSSPTGQQEITSARRVGHTSSESSLDTVLATVVQSCQDNVSSSPTSSASIKLENGEELLSTGLIYSPVVRHASSITLSPIDVRRWTLAAELFRETAAETGRGYTQWLEHNGSVADKIRNMPPLDLNPYTGSMFWNETNFSEVAVLNAAGILYGGLHALAWTAPFSSTAQRLLWRISSAYVMCFGIFITVTVLSTYYEPGTPHRMYLRYSKVHLYLIIMVSLASIGYAVARAYLVIECFILLFDSPIGVYDVPAWSRYFPHIS